jgi:threonine dehydrogenase-like Zn-dependent dehydrogenase
VFEGSIGQSEWERMRAPQQEGAFPFPVKYGYCATGVVEDGPSDLVGRQVFCLHPHQDFFNVPIAALAPIPVDVPIRRATLAANMETGLNAVWDSGAGPGDRIVVVGAGVVGLLVASLAARLPGAVVTAVDMDESRRPVVEALGAGFARPEHAPADADVVFHASASGAGLNTAIACAGLEATIVEMSWYGSKPVQAELGGAFHSRRLKLVSSQVSLVSPGRRARWDYRRRLEAALRLLAEPALDALVEEEIDFDDAPRRLPQIFGPGAHGLAPVIRYPNS